MKIKILVLVLLLIGLLIAGCSSSDISQEEYDALEAELEALQSVCPPCEFVTLTQLEAWAYTNIQSGEAVFVDESFQKALMVQQAGLEDGYLISINIEYTPEIESFTVSCNAIAAGKLYWWDPEDGQVNPWGPMFSVEQ